MNTILSVISKELHNQTSRFVFPSETASSLWAQKICGLVGIRSAALNRFLAWDRFKEGIIRSEVQDKEPSSSVLRRLFAEDLIRRNAEAVRRGSGDKTGKTAGNNSGLPVPREEEALPFRALIPPEYAEDGAVFAPRIAGLLPSLKLFAARLEAAGAAYNADDEDQDLMTLEKEYAAFLEKQGLFEPSWERPPLRDREHHYYIFFPEAVADFAEYEEILKDEPAVHLIWLEKSEPPPLVSFDSSRMEIRSVVLEIRRLHEEEKIPYEDIALSAADLESLETYLFKEMSLYNIPVRRRSGKPLADYGTGKLFNLISSCVSNNFSFTALKPLLLNERLPWSQPALNKALIKFGVLNNCVSAYRDKGKQVDIWVEAFKTAPREDRLRQYYLELKNILNSMTGAHSFRDLRKYYFAFRGKWEKDVKATGFLSRDACTDDGDAVLARCIEELSALIQLEEKYPDLTPPSPFQFFLGILREKQYVPVQEKAGVNIFPYRVAAAAPFACHFVLNASQGAATILYQPLKFLRQDKRKRLGLAAEDADVSGSFFRLYRIDPWETFTPRLHISASAQTFSGWAIPHSVFLAGLSPKNSAESENSKTTGDSFSLSAAHDSLRRVHTPLLAAGYVDYFTGEQNWWASYTDTDTAAGSADSFPAVNAETPFPVRLFSAQKAGFENWQTLLRLRRQESCSLLETPFPADTGAALILKKRIDEKQRILEDGEAKNLIRVSATPDLNVFFFCPLRWLYKKIIRVEKLTLEAQLLDDTSLGLLYHEILRDLFARIRETDKVFSGRRLADYFRWTEEITVAAAKNYPAFQGPLAVPLVMSQAKAIIQKLKGLLKTESAYFDGYAVGDLEAPFSLAEGGTRLYGIVDRVSVSPDGAPLIIDYKTGKTPGKADSTGTDGSPPKDFQMPLYIKLYEAKAGVPVEEACFFSINDHDLSAVIGSPGKKRGHARKDYQETMEAVDICIEQFAKAVDSLNFVPPETDLEACSTCDYRCLCRTTFTLNDGRLSKRSNTGEKNSKGDGYVN
jgi:hypothetical protein